MNIGGIRVSKKFAALVAGVAMCEYLRQTGQTMEQVQPVVEIVVVYLGGQSVLDSVLAWKGEKKA